MAITLYGSKQNIIQTISVTKTDTFTMTGTTFTDITGLSATITPSSSSNKILCLVSVALFTTPSNESTVNLLRNGTNIAGGTATGNRPSIIGFSQIYNQQGTSPIMISYLDSPATTSAVTYKCQCNAGSTAYINRTAADSDTVLYGRTSSTITLLEVAYA